MRKILVSLLLICLLAFQATAGISFPSESTGSLDCGSNAVIDNINAGTVTGWIYITSHSAATNFGSILTKGSNDYAVYKTFDVTPNGALNLLIGRGSIDYEIRSVNNAVALGSWHFVAFSYDTNGVAGDQKLYVGTRTTPVAEVSSYNFRTVGVGLVGDDSSFNLGLGNFSSGVFTQGGGVRNLGLVQFFNRQLTLGELRTLQNAPRSVSGAIGFWIPGFEGTGTQPDYSGNGNNCAVIGAARGSNVPLSNFFGL